MDRWARARERTEDRRAVVEREVLGPQGGKRAEAGSQWPGCAGRPDQETRWSRGQAAKNGAKGLWVQEGREWRVIPTTVNSPRG